MQMGIVSARHVDHVGLVVPDLDAAIDFFEQALGALLLWRVGPFEETPTGVPIESVTLAMLRLGPNLNVELQAFVADTQRQGSPSNIDIGAGHIAFFVNDIQAAAQSLRENGAEPLRGQSKLRATSRKAKKSGTSRRRGAPLWRFYGGRMSSPMKTTPRSAFTNRTILGRMKARPASLERITHVLSESSRCTR